MAVGFFSSLSQSIQSDEKKCWDIFENLWYLHISTQSSNKSLFLPRVYVQPKNEKKKKI